uniref:MLP-like protein 31 n=1 Tax=Noccaea caerulescens TaxID=107243 RepID=A0A1J3FHB3_NOCCA
MSEAATSVETETKESSPPEGLDKDVEIKGDRTSGEKETKEYSSPLEELDIDVEIKAPADKFHHMFTERPHQVSKASPGYVQGCELHEGEWGKVGSIIFWNYVHDGEPKVARHRIEAVDPEKNLIKFRVLEGDVMKEYKTFIFTIHVTPKQGGLGSVVKWHIEYERIDEKVDHPETILQYFVELSKEVDEHLLSEE